MKAVKIKFIVAGFCGLLVFFIGLEAHAWVNLFNDYDHQHPAFEWTWDVECSTNHTLTEWNTGITNENFFDTRFVLNYITYACQTYNWDTVNNYFVSGENILTVTNYDGIFDNSQDIIPNMEIGRWPYYIYGTLYHTSNKVVRTFNSCGNWSEMEGDTIANVKLVPEPQTILLLGAGLTGLIFLGTKRKYGRNFNELSVGL